MPQIQESAGKIPHTAAAFGWVYMNFPFHHIPKMLYSIEFDSGGWAQLTQWHEKPVLDDLGFVIWCVILLEAATRSGYTNYNGIGVVRKLFKQA